MMINIAVPKDSEPLSCKDLNPIAQKRRIERNLASIGVGNLTGLHIAFAIHFVPTIQCLQLMRPRRRSCDIFRTRIEPRRVIPPDRRLFGIFLLLHERFEDYYKHNPSLRLLGKYRWPSSARVLLRRELRPASMSKVRRQSF
jgi:hypothetical protein